MKKLQLNGEYIILKIKSFFQIIFSLLSENLLKTHNMIGKMVYELAFKNSWLFEMIE